MLSKTESFLWGYKQILLWCHTDTEISLGFRPRSSPLMLSLCSPVNKKKRSGIIALDGYCLWKGIQASDGKVFVQKISRLRQGTGILTSRQKGCRVSFCPALLGSRFPVIQWLLLNAERLISQRVVSNILKKKFFLLAVLVSEVYSPLDYLFKGFLSGH